MSEVDLIRARAFREVARLGSVSAAADALGYTQSAVSQQVSTLERDVGLTLLDRGRRPLALTPAGADLMPEVDALLARSDRLGGAIDELRGLRRGRVTLAAFPSAIGSLVPHVLATFGGQHPDVVVSVIEAETETALSALRAGTADVALVHVMPGRRLPDETGLERVAIGRDALQAVLPAGHPLAAGDRVDPSAMATEPLVVPGARGPGGVFRTVVERLLGDDLHVAHEVDDPRAAQSFAAAGLGVALMHGLTLVPPHPGVVVRPLTTSAGARQVEVLRLGERRVPAALALWDALRGGAAGAAGLQRLDP